MSTFARYTVALLSGALLPLTFAPMSWWPVALLCCAALNFASRHTALRQAFIVCLLFGFGLYATGASWIYVSIHEYGQASVALAALLTGLFAFGLGAVFTLPIIFFGRIKQNNPLFRALTFAALWVLGEWFRGWFLTGFPWLYLGYGFIDTWLAGWAPIGGVLAMGGMVAFSGVLLSELLGEVLRDALSGESDNMPGSKPNNKNRVWMTGFSTLLIATLWLGGGLLQKQSWTTAIAATPLNVILVQPNNPVLSKWDDKALPLILSDIREKTLTFADSDLIIWPESGIPALQNNVQAFLHELDLSAKNQNTGLITGIPSYSDGQYFNSVIGLGTASGSYQKRRLVPFGEYVPLEHWLRGLISFFDLPMSAFSVGADEQALIAIGPYQLATAICYEIAYSAPLAKDARQANLLLTVSNDTWFGDSLGPHQHLQIARIRALETGKPLLRATNDGITAFIDSRGQLVKQLPRFSSGVLEGQIQPHEGMTPYARWGQMPVIGLCLLVLLAAIVLDRRLPKALV
ncbi:MAG: apolipoprotein N-acyltransferase [Porticoccaceae bacterium]|nr:apolipoprotein N-acyltransferase [Porticoccaceae bacterium]